MRVNPYRLVRCYPTNYIVTGVCKKNRCEGRRGFLRW
nr:MAG TPA: hypothetical protein [Caudoviricetes sp.]